MALKDDLIKQYKDKLEAEALAKAAALAYRVQLEIQDIETGLKTMYPDIDWQVKQAINGPVQPLNSHESGMDYVVEGDGTRFYVKLYALHDWQISIGLTAHRKAIIEVRKPGDGSVIVNKAQFDLALGQLFAEQEA